MPTADLLTGTANQLAITATQLIADGIFEDGYEAIDFALKNDPFRPGSAANVILITDEDRDELDADLTFGDIFSALDGRQIFLNGVYNVNLTGGAGQRPWASMFLERPTWPMATAASPRARTVPSSPATRTRSKTTSISPGPWAAASGT